MKNLALLISGPVCTEGINWFLMDNTPHSKFQLISTKSAVSLEEVGRQCVHHQVELKDTLAGLAIKYGVEVSKSM